MKGGHANCLFFLGENPEGMTIGQLAEACCEDKAAVSRSVAQLVEKGLSEARVRGTAVVKITIEHITGKYYRR